MDLCEFKDSCPSQLTSGSTRDTQRDPVSKQTNKQTNKQKRVGDREMAQHLRVFAQLAEDLSVVSSTHDITLEPTELHLWEF